MSNELSINAGEVKISVFGDNNQFCTKHEINGRILESCTFYCDYSDQECMIFGELQWDEKSIEYVRCEKCLAAEIK